ncbi:hypothetical protein [Cryptosporangium minutisporangium]|uniref:Uncharacterized protein n=1 Tax=Cryptosporangium minutisporangium TaxID=113569 RepID=A0ABP6T570_9ACTN
MRFDGRPPDIRTLRAHAAEISTVRLRLAWIGAVCRSLTWDDESFGSLAGWIAEALDRVTARQAELVEYVAENFAIFADDLWEAVAAGDEDGDCPVGPVVIRSPWLLGRPADQYTYLHERITDGAWIDPALVVGHSRAGPDPFDPDPSTRTRLPRTRPRGRSPGWNRSAGCSTG